MPHDYATSFSVERPALDVFQAILDVRSWWSGDIRGEAEHVGDEFTYRHGDMHRSVQRVVELEPGRRVVWRVIDSELRFASPPTEWTGTTVRFEIEEKEGSTSVRVVHEGLSPHFACFDACSKGWDAFAGGNLKRRIETGLPQADPFARA